MPRRLLVLGSLAVACASGRAARPSGVETGPGAPAPPAAQPAGGGSRESPGVRLLPSTLRYRIERRIESVQELPNQQQVARLGFAIFVTTSIRGPADSGGHPTTFTIDSIVADSGVFLPITVRLDAARGLSFVGKVTAEAEFRNSTPSDSAVAQGLARILGDFRDFYPHLPAGGVTLGAAWTDTISRTEKVGIFDRLTVTAINRSRAAALEDRGGSHSVRIEVNSTVTLSAAGEQGGQPVRLEGSGTRAGVEFVSVDGRYLGGESRDSIAQTITLSLQGLVVPVRQVSHSLVTVLP